MNEPWEDQVRGSERAARRHQAERGRTQRQLAGFDTGSEPLNVALRRLDYAWMNGHPPDSDELTNAIQEVLKQCGRG